MDAGVECRSWHALVCGALSAIGPSQPDPPVIWGPPLIVLALIVTVSFQSG